MLRITKLFIAATAALLSAALLTCGSSAPANESGAPGNPLTSVTIGAKVKLHHRKLRRVFYRLDIDYAFERSFDKFYARNRRKAGTYTYTYDNKTGKWSYTP